MGMGKLGNQTLFLLLLLLFLNSSKCSTYRGVAKIKHDELSSDISPSVDPQPLLPSLAPSPLMPFINYTVPVLSGLCSLNFTAAKTSLSITATDCWNSLAPYLADTICCPQLDATLQILIGKSSIYSRELALNATQAKHCLSDIERILEGQGANGDLHKICSIYSSHLTKGSCPVIDTKEIEKIVDSSRLLDACEAIDPVDECCSHFCQNAISDAAEKVASKGYGMVSFDAFSVSGEHLTEIKDCKSIVLRWLASKLDPSSANKLLRGLSSCNINNECPLALPDTTNVTRQCGNTINNKRDCCTAMETYISSLQEQSFITNMQAVNCAALLGLKLQKANVSTNVYNLCQINLKDFSLQVESKDSGCLLPSLPSDMSYDKTSGISFVCNLNDNVAAPWPFPSSVPVSSCNKTIKLPALPKAASAESCHYDKDFVLLLLISSLLVQLLI